MIKKSDFPILKGSTMRVKPWETLRRGSPHDNVGLVTEMKKFSGKVLRVSEDLEGQEYYFGLKGWSWQPWMFDEVVSRPRRKR